MPTGVTAEPRSQLTNPTRPAAVAAKDCTALLTGAPALDVNTQATITER